ANPSAAAMPAVRPWLSERASTWRLSGPGAIVTPTDMDRKSSKSACIEASAGSGLADHFFDAVVLVDQHDDGLVLFRLFVRHRTVGANDQQIAHLGSTRRRAIERDLAAAALAFDNVGGKALAVVDVVQLDALVLFHARGIEEVLVDTAGAFVIQVGLSHRDAVNLGAKHDALHNVGCPRKRPQ